MKQWVYIYQKDSRNLIIGVTADIRLKLSNLKHEGLRINYLRPFNIAFDALAQKKLLDVLSFQTVESFIKQHENQTKVWLDTLN